MGPDTKAKGSAYVSEITQNWAKEGEPPNPGVPLVPQESSSVLVQAWESLEEAEYQRELALRNELIRQEKLEQLARRFDRKAAMRETWLSENQRLVAQVPEDSLGDGRTGSLPEPPAVSWTGAQADLSVAVDEPLHRPGSPAPQDWVDQDSPLQKNSLGFKVSFLGKEPHSPKMAPEAVIN